MDKTERLLDLVALLLAAREPVPFAELRAQFPDDYGGAREAAERKLERDKADLTALGVPLEYLPPDEESELGGYRIDRKAFYLPDPMLLPEESAALYAAGAAALSGSDFPFAQDLAHALRKIAVARGQPLEEPGPGSAARRLLIVRPGDPARAGKLRVLADAVARRKRVRLAYRAAPMMGDASGGERTERDVDPFGLAFSAGAWRLVGHCHLRAAQRVFVVDRIESLAVSEQRPNQPDFEVPPDFDAGKLAQRHPWHWVGTAPGDVTLRFAPGSEPLAARAFDVAAEPLPEGGARAKVETTWLEGLLPAVLSFGERVWIEGPEGARARAKAALEKLAARLAAEPQALEPEAPSAELTPPPALTTGSLEAKPAGDHKSAADAKSGRDSKPPARRPRSQPLLAVKSAVPADKRERLRRLLLIVPAALKRPGIKVEELARQLGLDPSDLLADIDLLSVVGRPPFSPDDYIDISVDEQRRVTVTLDQSLSRPPQLTPPEALALFAAAQEAAPADPAVVAALDKLTRSLPSAARQLYSALASRVASSAPVSRSTSALLAQLRAAAEHHRVVKLGYDKEGRGTLDERLLHPWAVIEHGSRWYVWGHDPGKGAARLFRVDRVGELQETGATFPDPGPLDTSRFQRSELYFPSGSDTPIALRFSPAAAGWAHSRWGARARRLVDGSVDISIEAASSAYAIELALSFVGEAEIVSPASARTALRDAVRAALARYR